LATKARARGGGHKLMFLELNGGWRRRIGLHLPQRRKDRASFIKGGYLQRHSDLLTILTVVAIMVVVGSGIYYPGESIHATMQAPGSSPGRLPRSSWLPWHHHRPQRLALSGLRGGLWWCWPPIRRARGPRSSAACAGCAGSFRISGTPKTAAPQQLLTYVPLFLTIL